MHGIFKKRIPHGILFLNIPFNILHTLELLLLSLLVETGQLPGAGLTQADKTVYN